MLSAYRRTSHVLSLSCLVGNENRFVSEVLGRQPFLHHRASAHDCLASLITVEDLDELVSSPACGPPWLRITLDGVDVPTTQYTTSVGDGSFASLRTGVNMEAVAGLFRRGATVTWHDVNQMHGGVRRLVAMLSARFSTDSGAAVFVTPAGQQGFDRHHDPVDLFVIQLVGSKAWRVWAPRANSAPTVGHYARDELMEPPLITASLQQGDVLYMPFNTPHVAVAEDSMSVHISVMIEPRGWSRVLFAGVKPVFFEAGDVCGGFIGQQNANDVGTHIELAAQLLKAMPMRAIFRQATESCIRDVGMSVGRGFRRAIEPR